MTKDEQWMKVALNEAFLAESLGEVPVGAAIISEEKLIAKAYNRPIYNNDPSAHAEIEAIRLACLKLKNYRLTNCTLYVTLEPCLMCFGAIMNARISRIVFGAYDNKKDVFRLSADIEKNDFFNHKIVVAGGVLNTECSKLLKNFFTSRRVLLK